MEKQETGLSRLPGLETQSFIKRAVRVTWQREHLSPLALTLARLSFGAMIVLIPFSWRAVLEARPSPPIYRDYTDFLLTASDCLLLAALILWGISLALAPRRIRFGPLLVTAPLAGLTIVGAISSISSVDPALSIYHTGRLILLDLLYLYIVNEVRSLGAIALPVALQALVQSIVGLAQFLQQHSVGLARFGELGLDPTWKGVSIVWSGSSVLLRAYGLTDHPNILGGCLAFALVLVAYWYLETGTPWRTPIAAVFALGVITLLLTFSRSAWLAFLAAFILGLILLFLTRQVSLLKDSLALLITAMILVLPFAWQYSSYLGVRLNPGEPSMTTGENRSIVERDVLNKAANNIFTDHAVLGIGLGAFPTALKVARPVFPFDYQPSHFALLEVTAETGIFGGLFYSLLLLAPWAALWLNRQRLRSNPATLAMAAVSALVLATTVVGLFDYYTWVLVPGRLWQWLVWGLWGTTYQSWIGVSDD
ncbi:MAG: O-antigen ligase family protein [Anaerolineae bacterium]